MRVVAIHAAAAGVHQMLRHVRAARLQDVQKTKYVRRDIRLGMLNAVSHACLRSQMAYVTGLVLRKNGIDKPLVLKITLVKGDVRAQLFEAGILQRWVVIVVAVI